MAHQELTVGVLVVTIPFVIYVAIAILAIRYEVANLRHHLPHSADRTAALISLIILGALWPLLWLWAMIP
jgi:Protein of unknown function (DUF3302)